MAIAANMTLINDAITKNKINPNMISFIEGMIYASMSGAATPLHTAPIRVAAIKPYDLLIARITNPKSQHQQNCSKAIGK